MENIDYIYKEIEEGIHNAFRRDLNLSFEEEQELERELRARIKNILINIK